MQITQRRSTLADAVFPGRGPRGDAALVVGCALMVALFAQIAVGSSTVPITGQTLAVLLTGAVMGAHRGAASLALYSGHRRLPSGVRAGREGRPLHLPVGGRQRLGMESAHRRLHRRLRRCGVDRRVGPRADR